MDQFRRTTFGQGSSKVEVIVNLGQDSFKYSSKTGGAVTLPANGFLVESPTFVAFHALNWAGQNYDVPAMFSLRSLDDRPLTRSRSVRAYHAFGSDKIRVGKSTVAVPKEMTLRPTSD